MNREQSILRNSIVVTVCVAFAGIILGILSGSFSVAFEGVYSLADASMSGLALLVARLIAIRSPQNGIKSRFNMGFWHLEPIVLAMNGTLLITVSIYALINAVTSLWSGGHDLEFSYAIVYAAVTMVVGLSIAFYEVRANRNLKSDFIALDAKAWIMTGGIAGALLVAFTIGSMIEGTRLDWLAVYIDPAVLAVICLVIIPLPLGTVRRAFSDILMITPRELRQHVEMVAQDIVNKHGFRGYHAYVARVGRARQTELHFIVPTYWIMPIMAVDAIRTEISDAIGGEGSDRWLTISFTADEEWAV